MTVFKPNRFTFYHSFFLSRYLKEIFNLNGDGETDVLDDAAKDDKKCIDATLAPAANASSADEGYVFKVMDSEEENFTYHTREGKEVKVVTRKEPPGLVGSPHEEVDSLCDPEQDVFGTAMTSNIEDGDDISYIYTRFHSLANAHTQRKRFLGAEKSQNFRWKEDSSSRQQRVTAGKKSAAGNEEEKKVAQDVVPSVEKKEGNDAEEKMEVDEKTAVTEKGADTVPAKSDALKKSGIKTTNANGSVSKYAPCANESDRDILETVASGRKRKASESANAKSEGLESECYVRDTPIFNFSCEGRDELVRRCVSISNIFRSLSFIPGNDHELGKHSGFLGTLGRLLLLHHDHSPKSVCPSSKQVVMGGRG